ncbi:src kinase-associated phosphoprotein 1 [Pyxicephalus adspersus]|uniref:src kinase-associated phosphoprotein 1 n=1 Tax=Pyxicephalus adspersus TaxID=30357 RepID=UPI003B5C785A
MGAQGSTRVIKGPAGLEVEEPARRGEDDGAQNTGTKSDASTMRDPMEETFGPIDSPAGLKIRHCYTISLTYPLDFQQRGGDVNAAATGEDYDDNHSLSYGTSLAPDEVSLTSDYVDDSEDTEEPEKLLKQGYLDKRNKDHGFFGSEWQKRWCVLTNLSFCYYSNERGKVPKGGFLIKDCMAKLVPHIRKDSRRDSCFELVSPGSRSYQFTASSPAEARDWVDQIQFLVKDILSASIPFEDDEESYDDVDSLNSLSAGQHSSVNRTNSPMEDEDIYEVVPDDDQGHNSSDLEGGSIINYADYYQGLWDCTSDKSDELSFQRGDIIRILSKVKYF